MPSVDQHIITDADQVESQSLAAHVAMCRMRNDNIVKRIGKLEYIGYALLAAAGTTTVKIVMSAPEHVAAAVKALVIVP